VTAPENHGAVKRALISLVYVTAIVAANWLTHRYGLVPIGFGLLVTAGTFAAGLTLLARNLGQDSVGRLWIVGLMIVGVALSWWLSTPALAEASAVAFALSELADMTVYTALRNRGRSRALLAAALIGGLIDTIVFLHIAGFPVTTQSVTGQMLVKVGISGLVAALLGVRRAVLRQPVHTEGA
jgi:uncharacterized PurR-regulated membrane protein YhhQ (DUF165 family)